MIKFLVIILISFILCKALYAYEDIYETKFYEINNMSEKALNNSYESFYVKSQKDYRFVPNVVGMNGMDALAFLENLGLKVFIKGN